MFVYNVYHFVIKILVIIVLYIISISYLLDENNYSWHTLRGTIIDSSCKYIFVNKHKSLIACKLLISYKYNDIDMESELFLNSSAAYYANESILIQVNKKSPIVIRKAELQPVIFGIIILLFIVLLCLLVF